MRSGQRGWIIGLGLALTAFALLAAIVSRQSRDGAAGVLAPGESETLHACVIEVLEEGTISQGEFEQPYQRLVLRLTTGSLAGQEVVVEHGLWGLTSQHRLFHSSDRVLVEHSRTVDGADLPLLLLFAVNTEPLGMTLNRDITAEEIVRTLVGSLGLLAGVPLTSLIAAWTAQRGGEEQRAQATGSDLGQRTLPDANLCDTLRTNRHLGNPRGVFRNQGCLRGGGHVQEDFVGN